MTNSMRILFLGSGTFGVPTLKHLHANHEIVGVVTQPDRPAGRGRKTTATPIAEFSREHNISPLLQPENINTDEYINQIRALEVDAWVVIAFGQKLSDALIEDRFAINLHASLLPRWRGAAPIHASILAQDEHIGNSVITIASKMDGGAILGQQSFPRNPSMTTGETHDWLATQGPSLIEQVLQNKLDGSLEYHKQDESLVTLARKLNKADGIVDLVKPAEECQARIHGLSPWPGVRVFLEDQPLKILKVEVVEEDRHRKSGTLIDASEGIVACGQGTALRLLEIQPPGKRIMTWGDYARGRSIAPDVVFQGESSTC